MRKNSIRPDEWLEYAEADLESAKILLSETENYHIVAYHSHQAVEKIFKRYLLLKEKRYPFIHELIELLRKICDIKDHNDLLEDVSFLMDLYTNTKYPHGDEITKKEATRSVKIAEDIIRRMKKA